MTPTQRKAMEQALEFIENHSKHWNGTGIHPQTTVIDLRAALAEQPAEQEPVAVVSVGKQPWNAGLSVVDLEQPLRVGTKLYTAPPPTKPAERVPLTDDEIGKFGSE